MKIDWPDPVQEPPFGGQSLEYVTVEVKGAKLKIWWDLSDLGIIIRSIEGDDITATHLKALHLGELREELQTVWREDPDRLLGASLWARLIEEGIKDGTATATEEELEYLRAARRAARQAVEELPAPGPRPGRGADHDFYREVAIAYIETIKNVGPRGVIKTMAEKWGVPRDKVAVWVRRARETGWLEKRTERDADGRSLSQGRAYGGDGPRLEKWRKKQEEKL
jgi:hypothetical protein